MVCRSQSRALEIVLEGTSIHQDKPMLDWTLALEKKQ
jgi:hypothetical protein